MCLRRSITTRPLSLSSHSPAPASSPALELPQAGRATGQTTGQRGPSRCQRPTATGLPGAEPWGAAARQGRAGGGGWRCSASVAAASAPPLVPTLRWPIGSGAEAAAGRWRGMEDEDGNRMRLGGEVGSAARHCPVGSLRGSWGRLEPSPAVLSSLSISLARARWRWLCCLPPGDCPSLAHTVPRHLHTGEGSRGKRGNF